MSVKKYELVTLKDVFDKVPADKIELCLKELGIMLAQSKEMADLLGTVSKLISGSGELKPECPEKFTWVDDGKGEVVSRFICGGDSPSIELKTVVRQ